MSEVLQLSPLEYEVTTGANPLATEVNIITDAVAESRAPGEVPNGEYFLGGPQVETKAELSARAPLPENESTSQREYSGFSVGLDAETLAALLEALGNRREQRAASILDEPAIPKVKEPIGLEMGNAFSRETIDDQAERVKAIIDAFIMLSIIRSNLRRQRIGGFMLLGANDLSSSSETSDQ